jgi:glycosyltransferase involved in cell wall biosynthesis
MKIMHVFGHTWGGAFVVTQLAHLQQQGHDVVAICPGPGPFADACARYGIRTVFSAFQGSRLHDTARIFVAMVRLVGTIRKFKPDVLHYHLIKATLVGRIVGLIARVPRRFSQMGGPLTLETARFRWLDLATAVLDTGVICPSLAVKSIYDRYAVTRRKTSLLYYGFQQRDFVAAAHGSARSDVRRELGLTAEQPVIGMIAYMYGSGLPQFRDVSMKGHETLIEAAADVVDRFPEVRFLVVGEDPDGSKINYERLKALVEVRDLQRSFIFTGLRSDIPRLIAAMDVVAVPSLSENCGGAVEPMAGGVPVVASATGGLPELVRPGKTGALFKPTDQRELALRLTAILELPVAERRRLGHNGQQLVSSLFDPENCVEAQLAIYERGSLGQLAQYHHRLAEVEGDGPA